MLVRGTLRLNRTAVRRCLLLPPLSYSKCEVRRLNRSSRPQRCPAENLLTRHHARSSEGQRMRSIAD
ncbi:hypothetical protein K523DRAFT_54945 [Schizophyllum commune Tattone D]|nr:hypothetical protein K523DRAFT_54945 [Schizophyllum commune Tattone D]